MCDVPTPRDLTPPPQAGLGAAGLVALLAVAALVPLTGCWAPLHTFGIPACQLPDDFRTPYRTAGEPLNLSHLTGPPPTDYILGPDDRLEVTVPGLFDGAETTPLRTQVMSSGAIHLPIIGAVSVGGMNLLQAQQAITAAYANGVLVQPRVSVVLSEKSMVSVVVLGKVNTPGTHALPKYENDVAHAIAASGEMPEDAADVIEIHRRARYLNGPHRVPSVQQLHAAEAAHPKQVVRIPLRGTLPYNIRPEDVILHSGDVVFVPSRRHEVFYVVGKLSDNNSVRFTIGDRERELGVGFILLF